MKELSDQRGEGLYLTIVKQSVVRVEETQRARYLMDDQGGGFLSNVNGLRPNKP